MSIFFEEKPFPVYFDVGGEKVQLLDLIQFDNKVLIYLDTYDIAETLTKELNLN